jgi:hypothetical protein
VGFQGEPRGEPRRRKVGRRGGSSLDIGKSRPATLEKGAGRERVCKKSVAIMSGAAARLGINPMEGVLDGV